MAAPPPQPVDAVGRFDFHGQGAELLILYIKTFFLSVFTLGVYSFWGRTRIRQFFWRNTTFAGHPFAWHGTGMEMFIGALKFFGLFAAWVGIVVLIAMQSGEQDNPFIALIFFLPLLALVPIGLHGAFRYRASRTSWQGRRLAYRGDLWTLARIFWVGAILTVATLSIYTPFFLVSIRKYFFENLYYGGHRFTFSGDAKDLLWPWVKFLLLFFPTLTLNRFWFQAHQDNYCWERTTFAGAPFRSTIRGVDLLMYAALLFIGGIFTLGIAVPFVVCAQVKYVFSNLVMPQLPKVNLLAQGPDDAGAFGDAVGEFLGTDASIGDGFGL
jgi:uncharacterized membrane protein YjgN (DUF898 family)